MYRLEVRASELVAILVVVVPVIELGFDATVDDVDTDVGIDARIGCLECIHSISPSGKIVRSWLSKNAAVWKSKLAVLGIYPTINWLGYDTTMSLTFC